MNALVVNLTRFGDLLQSQPVLAGLAEAGFHPGAVCVENFAQAAELLPGARRIFPLPGAGLLAGLQRSWPESIRRLEAWVREVHAGFNPELVVNLTPSLPGRLLTRRLAMAGAESRGFCVDGHGFNADSSPWAAFLQFASSERGASPFNVVDLFVRVAGLPHTGQGLAANLPDPDTLRAMEVRLARSTPAGTKGLVAFQLGASEDRRRWPVARFRELGQRLWEQESLAPMLLGSGSEHELARRYQEQNKAPCIDLVGKTSLGELAAALSSASLCVTNDTGTMHLAAALDVPVAAVFLATAQPFDTGPARTGCLCLEPDMDCHPCPFKTDCPNNEACRQAIPARPVADMIRRRLRDGSWSMAGAGGYRAWLTVLDDENWLFLESLSGHGDADRVRWIAIQRSLYRRFLDGLDPALQGRLEPPSESLQAEVRRAASEALAIGELLSRQGELLARDPRQALKTKFLMYCQRFQQSLESTPRLASLAGLWRFEVQNHAASLPGLLTVIERYRTLLRRLLDLFDHPRHET